VKILFVWTALLFAEPSEAADSIAAVSRTHEYDWIFWTLLPIAFFGVLGLKIWTDRARSTKSKVVARSLDCPFRAEATAADNALINGCHLAGAGSFQLISNVLEPVKTTELEITVLDYQFGVSYGTKSQNKYQTISRIESPLLKLPSFILSPETLLAKVGKFGGLQDIQIPDAPSFNKKYVVRGDDEAAVRAILNPDVRQLLEQLQHVTIEAVSNLLFVIRAPWVLQTVSNVMIEEDKRILAVFLNAQQSTIL
jgi:hypothetical protein